MWVNHNCKMNVMKRSKLKFKNWEVKYQNGWVKHPTVDSRKNQLYILVPDRPLKYLKAENID